MIQLPQMRSFLHFVLDPEVGCTEMKVFHATFQRGFVCGSEQYSRTLAGWYDDENSLIVDAQRLRGISAFVTVNPVRNDLLARSYNALSKIKHTTNDDDIVCIRWLYVDIDPVRPADISSTDDELKLAIELRDRILDDGLGFGGSVLWGCSGNGAWILARMPDMDNTEVNRKSIGRIYADLSARYSDDRVKIDTTTKNPSRVMCLPGTTKCKGSNVPARPHRQVTFDGDKGGADGGIVPTVSRPATAPPKLSIVRSADVA